MAEFDNKRSSFSPTTCTARPAAIPAADYPTSTPPGSEGNEDHRLSCVGSGQPASFEVVARLIARCGKGHRLILVRNTSTREVTRGCAWCDGGVYEPASRALRLHEARYRNTALRARHEAEGLVR